MPDSKLTVTKPQRDDSTPQLLLRMVEILNRNGGRVKGRLITDTAAVSSVDCLQFVAGGSGATIASGTFPDFTGDVAGFALAAGQPFPFEFTAIELSDGYGYGVDRESPAA